MNCTIEATTYAVRHGVDLVLVMKDDAGDWHVDGLRPGRNAKFGTLEVGLAVAQELLSRMGDARRALEVAEDVADNVTCWLKSRESADANPNQCSRLEATPA